MSKEKDKENDPIVKLGDMLGSILNDKNIKDDVLNHIEKRTSLISSGSLLLDSMAGFQPPGIMRFLGSAGGGKTSCALSYMREFLKGENTAGFYVMAEGRLSDKIRSRSTLKFVRDNKDWESGTCFVLECNIYETVFDIIGKLIKQSEESGLKIFFIVDSMDGLITKGDSLKSLEESTKIAGGAVIASAAMKKVSVHLNVLGHYVALISQKREAKIETGPMKKADHQIQINATGGNALLHYPSLILEFYEDTGSRVIYDNSNPILSYPAPDYKSRGKVIGRIAKGKIHKSDEDVRGLECEYPIIFSRDGDNSIWWEMEVYNLLVQDSYLEISGAWVKPSESFNQILLDNNLKEMPAQNGSVKAFSYLQNERMDILMLFKEMYRRQSMTQGKPEGERYIVGDIL